MIIEWLIFIVTALIGYCYYKHKKIHYFFEKRGLNYVPGVLGFGNAFKSTLGKTHSMYDLDAVYKQFPDDKYVGYIEGLSKIILIRDPEIVRAVTVKNFDIFMNRKQLLPESNDPLFGGSLFMMQGDKWRDMRTTLSPAFTGTKIKLMMPFLQETSDNVIEYIKQHLSEVIDVNDLMRKYSNDVIATAAFGHQVNSFKDESNEFYITGQNLFIFTFKQKIKFFFFMIFPEIMRKLGVRLMFSETLTNFFRKIVSSTIEYRQKNNVKRPDMIQLLIDASQGNLKHDAIENDNVGFATTQEILKPRESARNWKLDDLTSQVFIFFAAGYETVASIMSLCIHKLALNPDVQEKLYLEIKNFHDKYAQLTYDSVVKLKYLDCVLNETMRSFSVGIVLDRVCMKELELPPPREGAKPYWLKPGDSVYCPVNSYHCDLIQIAFLEENRYQIKPFTFLPFGSGPRNCIGARFAIIELKGILYKLILNYKIVKCEKTIPEPIVMKPHDFNLLVDGGSYVKFEARKG